MKIKIKDKYYTPIKVPQYNRLRNMLEIIFSSNPTKFDFHGIRQEGKIGLLVCGADSMNVREFEKFYSIKDIHFYFNKHITLLKEEGERRLTTI